jgi:hypothetical protein
MNTRRFIFNPPSADVAQLPEPFPEHLEDVRGRRGSATAEYAQNLEANLSDLLERIKSGRYQAPRQHPHLLGT